MTEILRDLSWNASREDRLRAMTQIREDPNFEYGLLIQPAAGKACWDNCATLICELSDERLEALIPRLLVWLQDLNWPGACAIRNRLMALPISMLKRPLEMTALYADLMNDDMWIEFLSAFSDHKALMAAFDPEARRILESARDASGQDLNGVPR